MLCFTSPEASRKIPSIPELLGAAKRDLASTLSERPGLTFHHVSSEKGVACGADPAWSLCLLPVVCSSSHNVLLLLLPMPLPLPVPLWRLHVR